MKGSIPRQFIDDLLTKSNIVDVINARVKLKKAGRDYQACCPFHHEKTPSFTVSEKKQFYYCFGCGAKGNAISFLMDYDKLEFVEAVEELAASAGLEVPYEKRPNQLGNKPDVSYQTKRNLYDLMQEIASFYQAQLPLNIPAQSYLQQRGLSPEIIERFQIGYVPNAMDTVLRQFGKNREEQKKLFDLGMLSRNDRGNVYDKFRNRIMFPIRDKRGRTVAFGGRVLTDEKPKYLNSPETITYHKGNELYGLYEALQINDEPEKL
ncbi:MAG: DNA primase, partial [Haemophilus parainfluenzae]|nr:DNA primase [Haemophilus parainfluenzae]